MKKVTIYTDGSSLGNPGRGGWGAVLIYGDKEKKISGGKKDATNNQMELSAAINALASLKSECEVDLYTDSTYVQKGISEWIKGWIKNNWKNSQRKPVKNAGLWKELHELSKQHKIKWHWVKAHVGNKYNEIADDLAREAAERV
jgi:ribonuclease HI